MSETDMSKYEKKIVLRNIQMEDIDEIMKLWSRCFFRNGAVEAGAIRKSY